MTMHWNKQYVVSLVEGSLCWISMMNVPIEDYNFLHSWVSVVQGMVSSYSYTIEEAEAWVVILLSRMVSRGSNSTEHTFPGRFFASYGVYSLHKGRHTQFHSFEGVAIKVRIIWHHGNYFIAHVIGKALKWVECVLDVLQVGFGVNTEQILFRTWVKFTHYVQFSLIFVSLDHF